MNPTTDAGEPKPRLALAIATGLGLGYLPKAPGTFGSLGGILLTIVAFETTTLVSGNLTGAYLSAYFLSFLSGFVIVVSLLGVWAAS